MSTKDSGAIADRYAAALFEVAEQAAALAAVESDLKALKAMIVGSADLQRLLRSPVISRQDQGAAVAALADAAGWHGMTRNLLGLLARNRRLFALSGVIDAYLTRLAAHRGEVTAHVVAATPLTDRQIERLSAALKKAIGKDVLLDLAVDPKLLGGMITSVGSRMVDASLNTKLQQLTLALKGGRGWKSAPRKSPLS